MCPSSYTRHFGSLALVLFTAVGAAAQQRGREPDARDCGVQAESFLNKKLAIWQERLNLKEWKIAIVMSRVSDLRPGSLGNIRWDADKKSAAIRVLRASESQTKCSATLDDMEFTVVHELIHLELASLPRSEASRRVEEHAVNRIAEALLKLDRGN